MAAGSSSMRDSVFYYVNFAGFNEDYDLYAGVFDTVLNSIKLPKPKVAVSKVDESKPSAESDEIPWRILRDSVS